MSIVNDNDTQVVTEWVEKHLWARPNLPQTILIVKPVNATDQLSTYSIKSGFGYFQIEVKYTEGQDALTNLKVSLDVPSFGLTFLTGSENYTLSTNGSGPQLPFDVGNGVIKGYVSFQYAGEGDEKDVYMEYELSVPFAGELGDTVSIFPVALNQYKSIEIGQSSDLDEAVNEPRALLPVDNKAAVTENHQERLLKFLDNYAKDNDKIVIEQNRPAGVPLSAMQDYDIDVYFLGVLRLTGSIKPDLLSITASLWVNVPLKGYMRITHLGGSLLDVVVWEANAGLAKGSVKVGAENNSSGGHNIWIAVSLWVVLLGSISTPKLVLQSVPF